MYVTSFSFTHLYELYNKIIQVTNNSCFFHQIQAMLITHWLLDVPSHILPSASYFHLLSYKPGL